MYSDEVKDLAKKCGWTGHGSSWELDQFLLPDGLESEPDGAYFEWMDAFIFAKEQYDETTNG